MHTHTPLSARGLRARMRSAAWIGALATMWTSAAQAQEQELDIQNYSALTTRKGLSATKSAEPVPLFEPTIGLTTTYARDALIVLDESEDRERTLIQDRVDGVIYASIGLIELGYWGLDIAAAMPFVLQGSPFLWTDKGFVPDDGLSPALGDARIEGRLTLLPSEVTHVGIAFCPVVTFPTAQGADFTGNPGIVFTPEVAISGRAGPVLLALNAGYRFQDEREIRGIKIQDQLVWRAGAGLDLGYFGAPHETQIAVEAFGLTRADAPFRAQTKSPVELLLSGRVRIAEVMINVGAGMGINRGLGAPRVRGVLGVAWAPYFADEDGDGIHDRNDKCPTVAEDLDGFEDEDGCPEADNDNDTILDDDDACPDRPEDIDEYQDEDGCPDPDNDADGVLDADDRCPSKAEDMDGFEDDDGCPDLDDDKDGVPDERDQCPREPEDIDNFEDADGCPEADNDGDGFIDTEDKCPNKPEDLNGHQDDDGCPDAKDDRDGDGILDVDDKCRNVPEDKDGFEDEDGCPDRDNDKDRVPDAKDACPMDPEDRDGFEDKDGCPDFDNDGDGIGDAHDRCPNKPETINGVDDDDGCPDKGAQLVELTAQAIKISEKVFFETGSAVIKARSHGLLDQVASVLRNHAQLQIRIEGHTDDRGSDSFNRDLSQRRAHAVRAYLIAAGIDASRLEAVGRGEEAPVASNRSRAGREMNRRVEFLVIEQERAAPFEPAPPPPPVDRPVPTRGEEPAREPAPARDPAFYYHPLKRPQSLKSISSMLWGSAVHGVVLMKANPGAGRVDRTLPAGFEIKIPRTIEYVVQRGDTLGAIADRMLGKVKLYKAIADASRAVLPDPSKMDVGMVLTIPLVHPGVERKLSR